MKSGYVLPDAELVLPDESLPSLVVRNAMRYRFADPMLVFDRLGLGIAALETLATDRPDEDRICRLAALLGISGETLDRMSSWACAPATSSVGGRPIRRMFLDVPLRRSCPACIRRSLHHRSIWNVRALTACAVHGTVLTETCPGCGRPPRWRGHRLEFCGYPSCFHDLRHAPETSTGEGMGHVRGLTDLYERGVGATMRGCGLDFGQAVEVAFVLGVFARPEGRRGRSDAFLRRHPGQTAAAMEEGWSALQEWPAGFQQYLERRRAASTGNGRRYGLVREFGGLAKSI